MNPSPRRRKFGFTLIELMVVMLILAILAAIVVPRLISRTEDAKVSKATADLSNLRALLDQFRLDTDRYPTTEEGLQALREAPGDITGWKGPYTTKAIPSDPWQEPYIYEYPGSGGEDTFVLLSYGADKSPGGDGNAADIVESE